MSLLALSSSAALKENHVYLAEDDLTTDSETWMRLRVCVCARVCEVHVKGQSRENERVCVTWTTARAVSEEKKCFKKFVLPFFLIKPLVFGGRLS